MNKLFIILIPIIVLSSCQKEDNLDSTNDTTKNLVKVSYVWDNGTPDIQELTYDAQGRVSIIIDDERTSTFNYVSASSLVVTEKNNTNNSLYRTYNCTLNSIGHITKISIINPDGKLYYTYNYTYNSDEHIIKTEGVPTTGSGYSAEYTILNGNVISSKHYNGETLSYSGQYTYDNSLKNKAGFSHTGYWYSNKLFGKGLKNMLVEYKTISSSNTLSWHIQNMHVLDADGYPFKTTTVNKLNNKQGVETYIFK